jgi:ribonuclease P protein component
VKILPLKSRQQIIKERDRPEYVCSFGCVVLFANPTPEKNLGVNAKYRANNFVRLCLVVSKKIHKKAVVRNKLRRRIKEAFRLVNQELLKNKYDYQILVKHSIFYSSVITIKHHIEKCLKGEGTIGLLEKKFPNEHKKIKTLDKACFTKTSIVLGAKLE